MKKLNITFLLPGAPCAPTGGAKVVYEYANRLSHRGHSVTVVHADIIQTDLPIWKKASRVPVYYYYRAFQRFDPGGWFQLDNSVRLLWVPSFSERYIPNADVVIATAWQTAEWAAEYRSTKGERFYLVQHLETWSGPEKRVLDTWTAPLKKIVISRWLKGIGDRLGENSCYVPNGLDFDRFRLDIAPEARSPERIMMLYHRSDWKGSGDGLRALASVKEQVPSLRATLFGVPRRPRHLPDWIDYRCQPAQDVLCNLYNEASIFVAPSWSEGWGLPASEAMMCGAAVAATDIGGHQEFAIHEKTALLSPAKDSEHLAKNILRLIGDSSLRLRLAYGGHGYIQQFSWKRAVDHLESLLMKTVEPVSVAQSSESCTQSLSR
jgi:glycosyltransferase involved in cell wall biosynthesis